MPDIFTKTKRSAVMSAIRGRGNKDTELRMMALLRAHGITGWRRQGTLRARVENAKWSVERKSRRRNRRENPPRPARRVLIGSAA